MFGICNVLISALIYGFWFKLKLLYKISTSYSYKITNCLSVLHLCMFDWFLTLIWLMFLFGNHLVEFDLWCLINWNRLSCMSMFAYECRLYKILNKNIPKSIPMICLHQIGGDCRTREL